MNIVLMSSGHNRLKKSRTSLDLARFSTLLKKDHHLTHYIIGKTPEPTGRIDRIIASCTFSWDAPHIIAAVNSLRRKNPNVDVQVGGVAVHGEIARLLASELAIIPQQGINDELDRIIPDLDFITEDAEYIFTARGCPVGCPPCDVARLEGRQVRVIENWRDQISGRKSVLHLMDNNVLASPWEHQVDVATELTRLADGKATATGSRKLRKVVLDGGFDWRRINEENMALYKDINWAIIHVAFDNVRYEQGFKNNIGHLLKYHEKSSRGVYEKIVAYVLYGFPGDTIEDTLYRTMMLRDMGLSPYLMRYMPPAVLKYKDYFAPTWRRNEAIDLARFANDRRTYWKCERDFGRYMGRKADGRSASRFAEVAADDFAAFEMAFRRLDYDKGFEANLRILREDVERRRQNISVWETTAKAKLEQLTLFAG